MSKPRLVCWTRMAFARAETVAALKGVDAIDLVAVESLPDLLRELPAADALVLHSAPVDAARQVIAALPDRLRWMHFLTAGRDGFEAAGLPRHLSVTHVPGASAPVVAEHAIALLLALGRRLPTAIELASQARWDRLAMGSFASLEGMRVAVLGTGAIGRDIARRLRAFGAVPIGISRSGSALPEFDDVHPSTGLHDALRACGALVIAIPLTPETRHLVDTAALAVLPPTAFVVNVARGAVIDQAALLDALDAGRLAGAASDVSDPEPPQADDRLWRTPRLLLTPHIASEGSPATARRLAEGSAENARRFAAGAPLLGLAQR